MPESVLFDLQGLLRSGLMTLATGACVTLSGATVVANFKAISATGTLDVEYFR